ncbi:MAG: alpha/beta fold hydrolase [Deltaproteobacteria bacterium]|nr:alpha/beta fold hydrolase [Deltaproteobacteria bacterium]
MAPADGPLRERGVARGRGGPTRLRQVAPLGRPLTMDLQARVLAAALDALGVTRASLVGCSMGGYALMAFARAYPGRMSKAVLMCTKAAADTDEARARREAQAQTALTQGPLAVTSQLLPNLVAPGVPQHEPALFARITALAAGATAQGIADALLGMAARPDSRPGMALGPSPALVIEGELDQAMPVSELRAMAEAIPGGKLRVIGGAGHYAMLERENEVAAEVVGFLE